MFVHDGGPARAQSRDTTKDFGTLSAAGNNHPYGIWSDGTTMWVADFFDKKLYAYKMSDRSRQGSKDFNTLSAAGNDNTRGIWSDGITMWAADDDDDKIYAYKMSDRSRDATKDFNTLSAAGNNVPNGIWSDGITMWAADRDDDKIYAYKMSDRSRDATKDFNTLSAAGNNVPSGIWSDGITMWAADEDDDKIYAYKMSDRSRDATRDLDLPGIGLLTGIWSDGITMWAADWIGDKIYAYGPVPPPLPPEELRDTPLIRSTAGADSGFTETATLRPYFRVGNNVHKAQVACSATHVVLNLDGQQSPILELTGPVTIFGADGGVSNAATNWSAHERRIVVHRPTCPGWPSTDGQGRVDSPPPVIPSSGVPNATPRNSDLVPPGDEHSRPRDCPVVTHSHDGGASHMHQASVLNNECVYNIFGILDQHVASHRH